MENPFDLDPDSLEECVEIVSAEVESIDKDALQLETVFYTAAKYLREQENF